MAIYTVIEVKATGQDNGQFLYKLSHVHVNAQHAGRVALIWRDWRKEQHDYGDLHAVYVANFPSEPKSPQIAPCCGPETLDEETYTRWALYAVMRQYSDDDVTPAPWRRIKG